jgi:signal transduction histidine kinase
MKNPHLIKLREAEDKVEKLSTELDGRKLIVATIAHELRTPLGMSHNIHLASSIVHLVFSY